MAGNLDSGGDEVNTEYRPVFVNTITLGNIIQMAWLSVVILGAVFSGYSALTSQEEADKLASTMALAQVHTRISVLQIQMASKAHTLDQINRHITAINHEIHAIQLVLAAKH